MKKCGDLKGAGDMRTSKESPSLFLLFFLFLFTSLSVTPVYPQAKGYNSAAISVTFTKETQKKYIYIKKHSLFIVVKKEPGSYSSAESSRERLTTSS